MKVVAFLGYAGSGKTTTMYLLTRALSSLGYRVGTVKHTHKRLSLDKAKKDSWIHSKAGASIVVAISPSDMMTYRKGDFKKLDVNSLIKSLRKESLDFIFVEGFHKQISRTRKVLTVMCVKSERETRSLLRYHSKPEFIISKNLIKSENTFTDNIPVLSLPRDIEILLNKIVS